MDGTRIVAGPRMVFGGYASVSVTRPTPGPAWSLHIAAEPGGSPGEAEFFAQPDLARGLTAYHYANPRFEGERLSHRAG